MMILISILFESIIFSTPGHYPFTLKAGQYTVHCFGGQGGSSYVDNKPSGEGGLGAYVKGTINITGTGKTFYAYVGGQSIASSSGL